MRSLARIPVALAAAYLLTFSAVTHATDVARRPLAGTALIYPNLIFGIDDSGSMDWEVMFATNNGLYWWKTDDNSRGWNADGTPFSPTIPSSDKVFTPNTTNRAYAYLFPLGDHVGPNNGVHTQDGLQAYPPDLVTGRFNTLAPQWGNVAPPIAEMAPLRSAAFNPIYYDSSKTYTPWQPRYDASSSSDPKAKVYADSAIVSGTGEVSAPTHPEQSGTAGTLVLNRDFTPDTGSSTPEKFFTMYAGQAAPSGAKYRSITGSWPSSALTSDETLTGGSSATYYASAPYYPATFWHKETCTLPSTPGPRDTCMKAPDGSTLKRYEIREGVNTYPSGRTYDQEIRNFANWFTYYRKRQNMMAAAMGELIEGLYGIKIGMTRMNEVGVNADGTYSSSSPSDIVIYDADAPDYAQNGRKMLETIYTHVIESVGTPTRTMVKFIGEQFRTRSGSNAIIKYSCQRNNMLVVTDGFATPADVQPPSTPPSNPYFNTDPYRSIPDPSITELASYYYATNLRNGRTDLTDGMVEAEDTSAENADVNKNLHMNTYGLTLGSQGTLWKKGTSGAFPNQFPSSAMSWPTPDQQGPEAVDDLWHATINGRGKMFTSADASETADALQEALADILNKGGTQTGVGVLNVNLSNNDRAYLASFTSSGWWGDFAAYPVVSSTGLVKNDEADRIWSAAALLDAMDINDRVLVTYKNGSGVPFEWTANIVAADLNTSPVVQLPGVSHQQVVDYHRGDRSLETSSPALLRKRVSRMGAIVNAQPAIDGEAKVAYVPANDGFVHAIDLDTGKELWAYMPRAVQKSLRAMAKKTWSFQTVLDGTPVLSRIGSTKYLVGGLGSGGAGFYALDVQDAKANLDETARATKVKWEFPAYNASTSITKHVGQSVGRPVFVRIKGSETQAVLLTSGYNTPTTGDGKGRVFVLNPVDGTFISGFDVNTLTTTAGTPSVGPTSNGEAGLAFLTPFVEPDGTVQYVYGGDLLGNVWRFDLVSTTGRVKKIATLKDASGNAQPIAAPIGTANFRGTRALMIGTGRILGERDFISQSSIDNNTASTQSVYVLTDTDGLEITSPRTSLVKQTITEAGADRKIANPQTVNWSTKRGWFVDLIKGERANTRPFVLDGVVVFVTNTPNLDACRSSAFLYRIDFISGDEVFENLAGVKVSYTFTAAGLGVRTTSEGSKIILHRNENDGTGAPQSCIGDGDVITCGNRPAGASTLLKNSWRQVLREDE